MAGEDPDVVCQSCGWSGNQSELYTTEIQHALGGDVAESVCKDLMSALELEIFNRASQKIAEAIMAVGLFPVEQFKKDARVRELVVRLMRAGIDGAVTGIGREMADIDREHEEGILFNKESDDAKN